MTHLFGFEPWRHPRVFFEGASRIVVGVCLRPSPPVVVVGGGGVPVEMLRHLVHDLFALRHVGHPRSTLVLLAGTLAVATHLPAERERGNTYKQKHTILYYFYLNYAH